MLFLKKNHYHDIQFLHIGNLPEDGLSETFFNLQVKLLSEDEVLEKF